MKIDVVRTEYKNAILSDGAVDKNPLRQLELWLSEAINAKVNEPTAMSLATISATGFPDIRTVLLKEFNDSGLTFFTNYASSKGISISKNPKVGIHFFWPELERQIRISGLAEKTTEEVSDNYFQSRPRLSQVAAVISEQSKKIPSRDYLDKIFDSVKNEFEGKEIQRPANWGGYLVRPVKFEFWQGRENRMHDRILYEKEKENWLISRLAP